MYFTWSKLCVQQMHSLRVFRYVFWCTTTVITSSAKSHSKPPCNWLVYLCEHLFHIQCEKERKHFIFITIVNVYKLFDVHFFCSGKSHTFYDLNGVFLIFSLSFFFPRDRLLLVLVLLLLLLSVSNRLARIQHLLLILLKPVVQLQHKNWIFR